MEPRKIMVLIACIVINLQLYLVASIRRGASTSLGDVRGRLATHQQQEVYQFLGIPYAEPPTGDRRFQKPVSKNPWQGELDATQYGPSCPQIFPYNALAKLPNQKIDEDCLVLNIYVPGSSNADEKKSVMVFFHGGGFNSGQGMAMDGSLLAINGDVVVVTINYRLDLLGFLYTGDDVFPGNLGLWDQLEALKWVRDHISSFDGDPTKVTVFGVSAGAMSIGLHLLSPHSAGLFQRAILQSGTPLTHLAFAFDPQNIAKNVSVTLGCSSDVESQMDTTKFKECLKGKNATEILKASALARTHSRISYRLDVAPVIDGDFITESPQEIFKKGENDLPFYNSDVMIGTNSAEGGNLVYMVNAFSEQLNIDARIAIPKRVLCDNVAKNIVKDFYRNNATIAESICNAYTNSSLSADEQSMKSIDLIGDTMFVEPAVRVLNFHAEMATAKETYQYFFSHQPNFNPLKLYFPWFRGANHLDELPFVFGPKVSYSAATNTSPREEELSRDMMTYWTNFAKYGDPNGIQEPKVVWPKYSIEEKQYIDINLNSTVGVDLLADRVQFWNKLSSFTREQSRSAAASFSVHITLLYTLIFYIVYCNLQH